MFEREVSTRERAISTILRESHVRERGLSMRQRAKYGRALSMKESYRYNLL